MLKQVCGVLAVAGLLSGCAAVETAITKKDLDVQTKMSSSIFLVPVRADERSIFLQVRNTTDVSDFNLQSSLETALAAKGYRLERDPALAHYILQANVLQIGRMDPTASQVAMIEGFGSALAGAGAGALIGGLASSGRAAGIAAGGLAGGAAAFLADTMVKDVTYSVITDIQISEPSEHMMTETATLTQGSGTVETMTTGTSDRRKHQTRILSTANQVNLELKDALPLLRQGLVTSISGLM